MLNARTLSVALFVAAVVGAMIAASGPTSAMPGWSKPGTSKILITTEQRDHIRNLHAAYKAAVSDLDWSVDETGHAPDTMRQARDLKLALRAEIFDVIHRPSAVSESSSEPTCPYSGKMTPVRLENDGQTLYL